MNALDSQENKSLRRLERTIESGLQSFVVVGKALVEIRDSRLYRESHKSFEAYCSDRWNIKRQRAYELIEASGVAETVSEISDTLPKESHAAELAALPEEEQAETWAEVIIEHGDKVTAADVKAAVAKKLPDKAARIPVPEYSIPEDEDEEFEPAEPGYLNADLDAVKAGYLALSQAKQIAFRDWIEDQAA